MFSWEPVDVNWAVSVVVVCDTSEDDWSVAGHWRTMASSSPNVHYDSVDTGSSVTHCHLPQ